MLKDYHTDVIEELNEEIRGLREKMKYTYCAYCDWRVEVDDSTASNLQAHVQECEHHPVFILQRAIGRLCECMESWGRWEDGIPEDFVEVYKDGLSLIGREIPDSLQKEAE